MTRIYLDYNASTSLEPEVVEAMRAAAAEGYGNPSSRHWAGAPARAIVEAARGEVAALLGCSPGEIVFTSGGSEANNAVIKGVFFARHPRPVHIITTSIEHPSVLVPCAFVERLGARVTHLAVDGRGRMDPGELRRAITPETALISVMHANNEVGTIQPLADCAGIAREHGIAFHTDAAQSLGKIPTRVDDLGVDLLSLAGHKFHAPKGIGALYVRSGTTLEPLIHGAGHEGGRRAGTESAPLAAALGAASRLARELEWTGGVRRLRDALWERLQSHFGPRVALNGHPDQCLPNTLNVAFVGRVGADVLAALPDVAASTGSACHAGRIELSPVLQAMRIPPEIGMGAVRFSLGRHTTGAEIDSLVERLAATATSPA